MKSLTIGYLARGPGMNLETVRCYERRGLLPKPPRIASGYKALKNISDAVFRVSIYWPSGYLCAQLTTESISGGVQLEPGTGIIELQCPTLPVVPGLYRIDLAIETKGLEIDVRQRCATLRVEPGNIAYGDFHIENTWKITETLPQPQPRNN